jgi:hypothetical protein
MKRSSWKRKVLFVGAASLAALALCLIPRWLCAENPVRGPNAAPRPAKAALAARLADISKGGIERPTETLLFQSSSGPAAGSAKAGNPRVKPGQVRWHATLEQACGASARSGKPVLLFSMMGRLDEQFC